MNLVIYARNRQSGGCVLRTGITAHTRIFIMVCRIFCIFPVVCFLFPPFDTRARVLQVFAHELTGV